MNLCRCMTIRELLRLEPQMLLCRPIRVAVSASWFSLSNVSTQGPYNDIEHRFVL